MLAKILEDMWVEPEVLEALSEEQRRILFLKMREEQVRRWREREEREESEGQKTTRPKKASSKHVTWLLGRDGDVSVCVIGQVDDFRSSKLLLNNRLQSNGMNGMQTLTLLPERDTHRRNSKEHIQLLLNDEDDASASPNDRSSSEEEEEPDSGSAEEDPKDPAEDSDSESDLKQWPPRYRPHPGSSHGNQPPLTARLSGAERTRAPDKDQEEKTAGRVAQLRRAFASGSSGAFAKPPVPTKPPHLQKLATPLAH